jgi:hypothetical protein
MAESSNLGAARFTSNTGHPNAYTKIGLFSASSPWLPISTVWNRVYLLTEEVEGLERYFEEKPGRHGTTVRRRPNVWCCAEIMQATHGKSDDESILEGTWLLDDVSNAIY